jgi:hypothetical protein
MKQRLRREKTYNPGESRDPLVCVNISKPAFPV